jgi:hypothetical protein
MWGLYIYFFKKVGYIDLIIIRRNMGENELFICQESMREVHVLFYFLFKKTYFSYAKLRLMSFFKTGLIQMVCRKFVSKERDYGPILAIWRI